MKERKKVSNSVVKRLPRYYRFLGEIKNSGMIRISSGELSRRMGLTASQIRQDLNNFGDFGQQGYGYNITDLHNEIGKILGVENKKKTILIGAGNLGNAIAAHMSFEKRGFDLIGIFDSNPSLTGKFIRGLKVKPVSQLDDFCGKEKPEVAVLCLPYEAAEKLVNKLYEAGIKNYWNFSHFDIKKLYPDSAVENVHLSDSLLMLGFHSNENL